MQFVWDERKAISNLRKHQVSFAEALEVFFDPLVVTTVDERHGGVELRFFGLGRTQAGRLLAVAFAGGSDLIPIISAAAGDQKRTEDL